MACGRQISPKLEARLGRSVAGRSRRAAPVGAFGAGDRTAHFHILCGSRSKARAARFPVSRETVLVAGEAQSTKTIKTMPPRRGSATSEFLGRPNLEAARRCQTAIQSHWIGPRSGERTNPTESPPNEGLTLRRGAQSAAPVFDSSHVARRLAAALRPLRSCERQDQTVARPSADAPARRRRARLRLRREPAKQATKDAATAAPDLIRNGQRLAANGVLAPRDRDIRDFAVIAFQDGDQRPVAAVDIVAGLQLAVFVDKRSLVGDVHGNESRQANAQVPDC